MSESLITKINICNNSIEIVKTSIVDLKVDAIVNAANERLFEGGGVCGAIFRAAGSQQLTEACEKIGGCKTGHAVITSGFNLPAKAIIHAVGPMWHGGHNNEAEFLQGAYKSSLNTAKLNSCHSVAFPLISAGIYGYPLKEAWEIAIKSCVDFLKISTEYGLDIKFAVIDDRIFDVGSELLKKYKE